MQCFVPVFHLPAAGHISNSLFRGHVLSIVGIAVAEVCKLFPVFIDKLTGQTAISPQTDIKNELNLIDQTIIDVLYTVTVFVSNLCQQPEPHSSWLEAFDW